MGDYMKHLTLNVPFSECEYYTCDYVALDALIRFYGYDTPYLIHRHWFFMYERLDGGEFVTLPRCVPIIKCIGDFGIRVIERVETDPDIAWRKTKARIESGHPVAALADTYHLESHYYPGLGHHSGHFVVVAGFDDELDTVHVIDPSWIVRFRGDLPLSDFKEAWKSQSTSEYKWVEIHPPDSLPIRAPKRDLQNIWTNIQLMLHGDLPSPAQFMGLKALHLLSDDLAQWKNLEMDRARVNLKLLIDQLQNTVTERDGHGRYLRHVAERLEEPKFAHIADSLTLITQRWVVFRNLCVRARRKALNETLEKLYHRLLEIKSLEESALLKMKEHVLSLKDFPGQT